MFRPSSTVQYVQWCALPIMYYALLDTTVLDAVLDTTVLDAVPVNTRRTLLY